ncbi:hypothetical protein [Vagococcus fluvialis]|uniref:hypothetical protein n=1 Tax=Vagococcus fluvialis TaxID=2738 RepID=UPI002B322058|nr:hypothetical protein QDW48_06305 [Vagococcus fluvialis]
MKPDFDEILAAVVEHGEPKNCKVDDCYTCNKINKAREFYLGSKPKDKVRTINCHTQFKYVVTDESGVSQDFYVKEKAMRFIKVADKRFNKALKEGSIVNGYKVSVIKLKGGE